MNPAICAINPGIEDTIWSTDTTSPGLTGSVVLPQFFLDLPLQGLLGVAFAHSHAEHLGAWHFAGLFGTMPCLAISLSFSNDACPNCW